MVTGPTLRMANPPVEADAAAAPSGSGKRTSVSLSDRLQQLLGPVRKRATLLRPLPLILGLAWLAHAGAAAPEAARGEPDLNRALALALAAEDLHVEPDDVHWIDAPEGFVPSRFERPRAVLRANHPDEPTDVYLARVRLSPEGRLLEVTNLHNLSDTSAVDERALTVDGQRVAWTIGGGGKTFLVHFADLAGEVEPTGEGWTKTKRWQHSLTNVQKTGQKQGIGRRSFKLDPAAEKTTLAFSETRLLIQADANEIQIPTSGDGPIVGERFLRAQEPPIARPGNLVTWAVDRVRQSPYFSDDQMQYVKAVAFAGLDYYKRFIGDVTGDDGSDVINEEFADLPPPVEYSDPETGWPPAPMEPMIKPILEGEGKWRFVEQEAYLRQNPGMPSPFVKSFIRTDTKRRYTQIWVLIWDPRQIKLHMMSGTVEPKSATGETGEGRVPREPEVMSRLVAGLNGGFQALHGEWGLGVERVVYLPPKPYAATITEQADGANGFGTWPRSQEVPEQVVSYRQNMTPLVMDDTINPYRRNWWGGVPPGWKDESRTVRSAICLTKEKFIAYLYGASIDADHMAFAMQRARCEYGIHLDMNAGHTGLEFYRAAPTAELPSPGKKLDKQWEAHGDVQGMPGWSFNGKRMLRYMGLMNFPRYIGTEARDFFYLTLRHTLPGEPLKPAIEPAEEGEGAWNVKGLPQFGWPYAIATTALRPDPARVETKVRILKLDPKAVKLGAPLDEEKLVVVFQKPSSEAGKPTLFKTPFGFAIGETAPADSKAVVSGHAPGAQVAAVAALGIGRADRMLYYAEVSTAREPAKDTQLLTQLLQKQLGCREILLLEKPLDAAIGGDRDLAGHPVARGKRGVRLVRANYPGAKRVFTDTPITKPEVWYPLQSKRIRYFKKKKKKEEPADEE